MLADDPQQLEKMGIVAPSEGYKKRGKKKEEKGEQEEQEETEETGNTEPDEETE